MRLDSDKELEEESNTMLLKKHHQLGNGIFPPTIQSLSRDYVMSNKSIFKNADDVTADVMAGFIVKKGYVTEHKNDDGRIYHLLSESGEKYVQSRKEV